MVAVVVMTTVVIVETTIAAGLYYSYCSAVAETMVVAARNRYIRQNHSSAFALL